MTLLRIAFATWWATVLVLTRRPFRGAKVEGWSWRQEILADSLRRIVKVIEVVPIPRIRRLILPAPIRWRRRRQVEMTRGRLAGRDMLSVTPKGWRPGQGTMLYLHGGGYAICSHRSHRDLITRYALAGHMRVIAPNYRLAPEHPYPAALEDALAAVEALITQGVEPACLFIGGDSAGAGLSVATLLQLKDQNGPQLAGAILLSPWVDLTLSTPSVQDTSGLCYLTRQILDRFAGLYTGDASASDPLISPVNGSLAGLPPLLVMVGDSELIRDEGVMLAERAKAAGVSCQLRLEPGMLHAWLGFAPLIPDGAQAFDALATFVHTHRPTSTA